jgi:hypothetical protein
MLLTATCWKIGTIDTKDLQRREEHAQICNARRPGPRVRGRDRGHRRRHHPGRDGVQGQILPIKGKSEAGPVCRRPCGGAGGGHGCGSCQTVAPGEKGALSAPLIGPRRARNPFNHSIRHFVHAVALRSIAVDLSAAQHHVHVDVGGMANACERSAAAHSLMGRRRLDSK